MSGGSEAFDGALASIVVLVYRAADYIQVTLDSVAAVTYRPREIVVVDDASDDGTPELVREWMERHPGVVDRLIVHPRNLGVSATVNDGVAHSSGEFLKMLSADDMLTPGSVSVLARAMAVAGDGCGMAYGRMELMDESGEALGRDYFAWTGLRPRSGDIFRALLGGNFVPGVAVLLRRSAFEAVGGFDSAILTEDYDAWLRIARHYTVAYVDEPVAIYRVHESSVSRQAGPRRLTRARLQSLQKHLDHPESDVRSAVVEEVCHVIGDLVRMGDPESASLLRLRFRLRPSLRDAALAATYSSGMGRLVGRVRRHGEPPVRAGRDTL